VVKELVTLVLLVGVSKRELKKPEIPGEVLK
jgi:hypothetical protein